MEQPKQSLHRTVVVIIPFYNGSRWIERALSSVYNQTVPASEIVIVNDGSLPDEQAALETLSQHYPFTLINKENGGQGSARNAGVAASTSQYISFLDQDDYYIDNHIELLVSCLPENDDKVGFIYGDLCVLNEQGEIDVLTRLNLSQNPHPKKNDIHHLINHSFSIFPSASLISRRAFEAIGGFDEQFIGYEDDDLFFRMLCAMYTHTFLNTPVAVWCKHKDNTSDTLTSTYMAKSRLRYFKKLLMTYPWGIDGEHFYIGNNLVSRFRYSFVRELICSCQHNHQQSERQDILKNFMKIIWSDKHVTFTYKLWNIMFLSFIHRWAHRLAMFHKHLKLRCECG